MHLSVPSEERYKMENSKIKKKLVRIITIFSAFVISIVIVGFTNEPKSELNSLVQIQEIQHQESIIPQRVEVESTENILQTKMYIGTSFVGVITNKNKVLSIVNEQMSEARLEYSDLGFSDDIWFEEEMNSVLHGNIDSQIAEYLIENKLIYAKANKVMFSNGAIIYVDSLDNFEDAKYSFVENYVGSENMKNSNSLQNEFDPYWTGTRFVSFEVLETINITEGYTDFNNILRTKDEILSFLSFGYEMENVFYKSNPGDTAQWIAMKNGITIEQLLQQNKEVLKQADQIILEGTMFDVTKYKSPMTIQTIKEIKAQEKIYPESPQIIEDSSLPKGEQRVEVVERLGTKEVVYSETYQNEKLIASNEVSQKVEIEPVRGVISVGTYEKPDTGSGLFEWPMKNAYLMCGWGCYSGHQASDIAARTNGGYGPIYASDTGVVLSNSYSSDRGYNIVIDHNNGYISEYLHMEGPGYFSVGERVSRGEQIGYVGMTGITTAPHVHMIISENGTRVNPCDLLGC